MIIGGFQSLTLSDFPDKVAAIVFSQGCNFRCPYCHNQSLWSHTNDEQEAYPPEDVLSYLKQRQDLLQGVVVTGGEPTLQTDLSRFLYQVKELDLRVKLDTNGSQPEVVSGLLDASLVDYIAMDVKAPKGKYSLLCGVKVNPEVIRSSIDLIAASGVPHHFRTTFYRPLLNEDDLKVLIRQLPKGAKHVTQAFREPPED